MFSVLVIAFASVYADDSQAAEHSQPAIVHAWAKACDSVETVHSDFTSFQYDHTYQVARRSSGTVYFASPTAGFWSYSGADEATLVEPVTVLGIEYSFQSTPAQQIIWSDDDFIVVNLDRETILRSSRGDFLSPLLGIDLCPKFSDISPFLPGLPDKSVLSSWEFNVVSEADDEVRLAATPMASLEDGIDGCELILHKQGPKLHAVRYLADDGRKEKVFVFKSATFNPPEIPEVDLREYFPRAAEPAESH